MSDSPSATGAEPKISPRLHVSEEFDGVMERIAKHAETFRSEGAAGEALGGPTPVVVEALLDTGAFLSTVPVAAGGYEFSPRQVLQLMETLAWHEASTGWNVLGTGTAGAGTGAFVADEAIEEYFGEGRIARLVGQGTRLGDTRRVEGGYEISGRWSYNSGSPVATHIHTGIKAEDGSPMAATLPIEKVELIENWDVLGLRATGSSDYSIDGVFVPDTHIYPVLNAERKRGGTFYKLGLPNIATLHHAGWALGASKRLLEEMRALAAEKAPRPGTATNTDQFYAVYAELDARYRGARAMLMEIWADIEAVLDVDGPVTTEHVTLIHHGTINAKRGAQMIANGVATWAGTNAMRPGPIQRYIRDVYTGVQHLLCSPPVQQSVGKQLSGLASDDAFWIFYDLVEPGATPE